MDSSSEGSFAWTDASNDSSDDDTMAKNNHNINQSGEESDSGKTYKKKLQARLFSGGEREESNSESSQDNQSRKRKLSLHQADVDNSQNHKKKRVKAEPESDADVPIKKNKSLTESTNELNNESFLNSKVKNEHSFAVPSPEKVKKNKKKNVSSAKTSMSNGNVEEPELQSLSDSKEMVNGQVSIDNISVTDSSPTERENKNKCNIIKVKNNKKKRERKSENLDGNDVQNGAEESTVTECNMATDVSSDDNSGTYNHVTQNKTRTNKKSNKNDQELTILNTNNVQNDARVQINSESSFGNRKSKISEKIEFEEDDSYVQTESNSTKISVKSTDNKKLISFLESSATLRPYRTKLPSALVLTDDDDVWLIRCPKDVKLESFQNKKWILDSRCKIKLDGQTYEGDTGDTKSNITVLSSKKDRPVIRNLTINGCIRLRRRLPKVHIQEDNVMVNNQTNFIPLPDTKCRHPLLGLHYKKAMKLPTGVTERLRAARDAATSVVKKKKRGRERPDDHRLEAPSTFKMEHEVNNSQPSKELTKSMIISKKKKNKRKHSDVAGEESAPRHKKPKRNLESAEVWESEKAIEENLFNF